MLGSGSQYLCPSNAPDINVPVDTRNNGGGTVYRTEYETSRGLYTIDRQFCIVFTKNRKKLDPFPQRALNNMEVPCAMVFLQLVYLVICLQTG